MAAVLIQGPAIEPLSLADAKLFLRVAHDDDDDLITALISAARATTIGCKCKRCVYDAYACLLPRDQSSLSQSPTGITSGNSA
jgi:uncharacterized phiE125 gp8 family phage protein